MFKLSLFRVAIHLLLVALGIFLIGDSFNWTPMVLKLITGILLLTTGYIWAYNELVMAFIKEIKHGP